MSVSIGGVSVANLTAQPYSYASTDVRRGRVARAWRVSGLLAPAEYFQLLQVFDNWRNAQIDVAQGELGQTVPVVVNGQTSQCWFESAPDAEKTGPYFSINVTLVDAAEALRIELLENVDNGGETTADGYAAQDRQILDPINSQPFLTFNPITGRLKNLSGTTVGLYRSISPVIPTNIEGEFRDPATGAVLYLFDVDKGLLIDPGTGDLEGEVPVDAETGAPVVDYPSQDVSVFDPDTNDLLFRYNPITGRLKSPTGTLLGTYEALSPKTTTAIDGVFKAPDGSALYLFDQDTGRFYAPSGTTDVVGEIPQVQDAVGDSRPVGDFSSQDVPITDADGTVLFIYNPVKGELLNPTTGVVVARQEALNSVGTSLVDALFRSATTGEILYLFSSDNGKLFTPGGSAEPVGQTPQGVIDPGAPDIRAIVDANTGQLLDRLTGLPVETAAQLYFGQFTYGGVIIELTEPPDTLTGFPTLTIAATGNVVVTGPRQPLPTKRIAGEVTQAGWNALLPYIRQQIAAAPVSGQYWPTEVPSASVTARDGEAVYAITMTLVQVP